MTAICARVREILAEYEDEGARWGALIFWRAERRRLEQFWLFGFCSGAENYCGNVEK